MQLTPSSRNMHKSMIGQSIYNKSFTRMCSTIGSRFYFYTAVIMKIKEELEGLFIEYTF